MVAVEVPESLNELITAMGKHLGDKYTVHHMEGEDTLNEYHNIVVIDNDIRVSAWIKAPRPFVIKSEDDLRSYVEIMSREALKTISIEVEKPE